MNRYDHTFRALLRASRAGAIQKVGFARDALRQHRDNGFGPEDDEAVVQQFDLSGMTEYWEIELSEPMDCHVFAHLVGVHFFVIDTKGKTTDKELKATAPAASKIVDHIRAGVMTALRAARAAGEPWFIAAPEEQSSGKLVHPYRYVELPGRPSKVEIALVVQPDPPVDGVDLSKLRVRPRAAAEWMLAMPKRRHLVPPSLGAFLTRQPSAEVERKEAAELAQTYRTGAPGRPTSAHLVKLKLAERATEGETLKTCKAEAEWLSTWLKHEHPGVPQMKPKTLQTIIAKEYKEIPKSIPK